MPNPETNLTSVSKGEKGAPLNSETSIKSASEREHAVISSPTYDKMKYKELQSLCKQLGIKANSKKAVLVEALKSLHASKKAKEC